MAKGPRKTPPGVSMGGLEVTPAQRKRERKRRAAEERRWAAKAGPLKVYHRDGESTQSDQM